MRVWTLPLKSFSRRQLIQIIFVIASNFDISDCGWHAASLCFLSAWSNRGSRCRQNRWCYLRWKPQPPPSWCLGHPFRSFTPLGHPPFLYSEYMPVPGSVMHTCPCLIIQYLDSLRKVSKEKQQSEWRYGALKTPYLVGKELIPGNINDFQWVTVLWIGHLQHAKCGRWCRALRQLPTNIWIGRPVEKIGNRKIPPTAGAFYSKIKSVRRRRWDTAAKPIILSNCSYELCWNIKPNRKPQKTEMDGKRRR